MNQLESELPNELEEADVLVCAECDGNYALVPFLDGDTTVCPNCQTREGKSKYVTMTEYEAG